MKINKIGVILLKIVVSGTPGVGKHTISIELSRTVEWDSYFGYKQSNII